MYICICIYIYIHEREIYSYVFMYVCCMYIYIYIYATECLAPIVHEAAGNRLSRRPFEVPLTHSLRTRKSRQ